MIAMIERRNDEKKMAPQWTDMSVVGTSAQTITAQHGRGTMFSSSFLFGLIRVLVLLPLPLLLDAIEYWVAAQ